MKCPRCGGNLKIVSNVEIPYVDCNDCTKKGKRWNETIIELWQDREYYKISCFEKEKEDKG